ncbi:MAG: phospho-sugar mutase, partial [Clostridia bacterium]|nr:phospho-sugar mutase [Clostridia bacterium]
MSYKMLYDNWVSNPLLCAEGLAELKSIENDEKEIEYRFGAELAFGTGGMRGFIGYGTNMMNIYTIRRATKGLADYIIGLGQKAMARGVAISYDTRRYSHTFAMTAAGVLIANGIRVYMYSEPRPVPMLSYAVR